MRSRPPRGDSHGPAPAVGSRSRPLQARPVEGLWLVSLSFDQCPVVPQEFISPSPLIAAAEQPEEQAGILREQLGLPGEVVPLPFEEPVHAPAREQLPAGLELKQRYDVIPPRFALS